MVNSLYEMFNEISRHIDNLSKGGCGVFAYFMTLEMRSRGLPCIINFYDYTKDVHEFINRCEEFKNDSEAKSTLAPQHVFLKSNNLYFDGGGIIRPETVDNYNKAVKVGTYSLPQLRWALKHAVSWNPVYDRTQNKMLHSIIKKHLLTYEKDFHPYDHSLVDWLY